MGADSNGAGPDIPNEPIQFIGSGVCSNIRTVTQSFNTTTSMGRLTLNVLLSFAQFEREVIGERVRDKIAASKQKGLWVGGPIPLGYRSEKKQLVVVESEATLVRRIFHFYRDLGSVGAVAEALDTEGTRTRQGHRFRVGALAHLLKNRFYRGEIVWRGCALPRSPRFRGNHTAIGLVIDRVSGRSSSGAAGLALHIARHEHLLQVRNGSRPVTTTTPPRRSSPASSFALAIGPDRQHDGSTDRLAPCQVLVVK
jgi:hypothetical protein